MPFNGNGVFNRIYSWVQDAANGIVVSSSRTDTDTDDIADGLSQCVTRDGQSPATANLPMGGFKLTGLAAGTTNGDSVRFEQLAGVAPYGLCNGRITGTSGSPVTTGNVTAIETIYFTPYGGDGIALYNGSAWIGQSFAETSIDVPDATNCYDLFGYSNGGVFTLELTAWTNPTTRATALTVLNGVLVKNGAPTRRYLGTIYCTTAGNGQTEDSETNRFIWNYYNRVRKPMRATEATNSWNYTTATIRQANNSPANQLNFVIGVDEDMVSADILVFATNTNASVAVQVGVGLDSVTAFTSGGLFPNSGLNAAGAVSAVTASLKTYSGVGLHYLAWLEYSVATGTTTWYGDNATPTLQQSGIHGEIWC